MTNQTIDDIIKRIGPTMRKGSFEEALGMIRHLALDQKIRLAQGHYEQENYEAAREAIADAERYAFSDEEKGRVNEVKTTVYKRSIDGALSEAVTFMAHMPTTPEDIRKAIEYCQKAQRYAMSIEEDITQRVTDVIGFRYDAERGPYNFRPHAIADESLQTVDFIKTMNQILEEMNADFRVGPVYEDQDNGAFGWQEVVPYALGIYQRKMKATDPHGKSWYEAMEEGIDKIVRRDEK